MIGRKVSVIISTYNNEKTIIQTLESIMKQTYKNYEVIICDDGSKDKTELLVKKFQEKYPEKIIVVKNVWNCGAAYGRNHAIQHSSGDYIAIIDGDDLAKPDRLEKQVAFLEKNPEIAIVGSNVDLFDENGIWKKNSILPKQPSTDDILKNRIFCNPSTMIRREVVVMVQGFTVAEWTGRGQDTEFWSKIFGKGYKGYNIQESLTLYRVDSNEINRRKIRENSKNYIKLKIRILKNLNSPLYKYTYLLKPIVRSIMPKKLYAYYHLKMGNNKKK